MRPNNRPVDQTRPIKITRQYTRYAEGSVLIEFGETKVLCNATIEENIPRFLKGQQQGWITAEYGRLTVFVFSSHLRHSQDCITLSSAWWPGVVCGWGVAADD